MVEKLRALKNQLFTDWVWDLFIIGGGCALIGAFTHPLIGVALALLSNIVSIWANKLFELKDFCLRLLIPLMYILLCL